MSHDSALSDVYQHIQQAVKKAVEAESNKLKSEYEVTLKRVREERDSSTNVALQYKRMLDEYVSNDTKTRAMKEKFKSKLERVKKEVVASNERILKIITEEDDGSTKNNIPHHTTTTITSSASAAVAQPIAVAQHLAVAQPLAVAPKEANAKQAMLMIMNKPSEEAIDLTVHASSASAASASAAAYTKTTTSPKKVIQPADTEKTSTAAKRSKLSASLPEPGDSEDSHTDDGKYSTEDAYFLYEKAHSDRNHKVDFSDCRLENLALTPVDFVGFTRHFHLNDAQKEIVLKQYTSLLKVPVQEVNGSCIVCGSFCNKGATGIFCSHVTCAKCFAMYLYFAGEKIQGNWKTKNRYLKCPGVVLNKQCHYMTTQ